MPSPDHDAKSTAELRKVSGSVEFPADWLTSFLYILMRDSTPTGKVESLVRMVETESREGPVVYTNGWLAQYAKHLADRLRESQSVGSFPKDP